jgi:hypothetical protein
MDDDTSSRLMLQYSPAMSRNFIDRMRAGRARALASTEKAFIVSSVYSGKTVEHRFSNQPTIMDLMEKVGRDAKLIRIEVERRPRSGRPNLYD